ncbi:hypothetical protein QFC21_007246 [Naganishia friedmannii]|uniref:Uncharacterized protein n=1 Tax=Naganishia friedmannii TaxID=89922 RepID=A0ACC2UXK9_9TREE|nr:hypothetical protein QFC21_007246 [Naganishia friedmannii]
MAHKAMELTKISLASALGTKTPSSLTREDSTSPEACGDVMHRYEGDVNEEAAFSPPEAPALPSFDIDPCLVGAGLNLQPYDIALSPKADLRAQDDHEYRNTLEFSHFLGGDEYDNHAQNAQSGPMDMISADVDLWMTQGCKAALSVEHASKAVPVHEFLLDDGNSRVSLEDLMESIPTLLLVNKEQAPWNPLRNASFEGSHRCDGRNRWKRPDEFWFRVWQRYYGLELKLAVIWGRGWPF